MSLKVYYLDDEPDICDVFKENFATSEIEITTFCEAEPALAAIHKSPPDLIFLDYRIHSTNGDVVAQQIKVKVPLILLTGDLRVTTQTVFDKMYSKQPFPWDEIEIFLREHLELKIKKEAM